MHTTDTHPCDQVTAIFSSSLEVMISVFGETPSTGRVFHCADAFATIVVVDAQQGLPTPVPFTLAPSTHEERLRLEVRGRKGGRCTRHAVHTRTHAHTHAHTRTHTHAHTHTHTHTHAHTRTHTHTRVRTDAATPNPGRNSKPRPALAAVCASAVRVPRRGAVSGWRCAQRWQQHPACGPAWTSPAHEQLRMQARPHWCAALCDGLGDGAGAVAMVLMQLASHGQRHSCASLMLARGTSSSSSSSSSGSSSCSRVTACARQRLMSPATA
jgi:acyl-CoA hydrolase